MDEGQLRQKVRTALVWRSGTQFVAQAVQWAITILVIRLLTPADYGLAAMAEAIATLLTILAGAQGFANALVQAPDVSERQIRQFFGLLLTVCFALGAVQYGAAGLAAAYYGESTVGDLLRVQAVNYLLMPFIAMPVALASRKMDFKRPALVHFWAMLGSGLVVLALAYADWGVWALIAGSIAMHLFRAVGMALAMTWFVRPEFRFDGLSKLIGFGGAVILNSLIWFFYAQADIFIAGRALPAAEVGLYSTALFLATLPVVKLIPVLNEVGFTAYSRIQHDPVAVKLNFLKAVRLVSLACFPIFVGLGATAEWFVPVVLGAQWLAAVPLLQLLALAMPLYALGHLMPPAVNALGQPRVQTVNALIGLAIMPAAFLVGVRYGPLGLATVWLAAYPLLFAITSARALRVIGASFADLGRAALPPLASALIMGGAVLGLAAVTDLPPVAELLLLITTGVAAYVAAVSLLFPALRAEALDLIRR